MITAQAALEELKAGNARFVSGIRKDQATLQCKVTRSKLATGQNPFAIILGCSDSRVPAELIFDQGLGDLFVIRIAGNIVAPSQIGSIEFAVSSFGTPLVVVLGHSTCGAVQATLDELKHPKEKQSPNLRSIVERIEPAVKPLMGKIDDPQALLETAIHANVQVSVATLKHGSCILEKAIAENKLTIVGAEYSLKTGKIQFF